MLTGHMSGKAHRRWSRARLLAAGAGVAVLATGVVSPSASADPDPTIAEVSDQVERLHHEAEQAIERYNTINEQVDTARRELSSRRADVREQRGRTEDLRVQVERLVLAEVAGSGGVDTTARMLSTGDPDAFIASLLAMRSYSDHTADLLTSYENAQAQLGLQVQQAQAQVAEIAAAREQAAAAKAKTDAKAGAAEALLAELEEERAQRIAEREARQAARAERIAQRAAQEVAEQAALDDQRAARIAAGAASQVSRDSDRDVTTTAPAPEPAAETGEVAEPEPAPAEEAPPAPSGDGGGAVGTALAQVGDAYVYGAAGPDAFDCSGLTMYAWSAAGVSLPHSAAMQSGMGVPVSRASLQPGDLVFYYSPISHVGIYAGNGQLVHAANPSAPVEVVSVDSMPITTIRRVG